MKSVFIKFIYSLLGVSALALFLFNCDMDQPVSAYTGIDQADDSIINKIDSLIEPYLVQYNYLIAGIVREGDIVLTRSYGSNKLNTIEQYASVSKPVTATMTLVLLKSGLIEHLVDPIDEYDEQYHDVQPSGYDSPTISFFHLLTHTSGIVHLAPLWQNGKLNMLYSPGADASYSTKAYGVLGDILETISGKSYQQLLTDIIEEPICGNSFWSYPLVQTTPGAGG
jgi:CubicO group peptidase (beta-lactamase class C family)